MRHESVLAALGEEALAVAGKPTSSCIMNAAGRSAKRLFDDAQLLADAARFSVMPFSS